ncbi:hypothetical protein Bind_0834 [Beijerinckia indica subsp. indica ATCC 9039]|uniref:TIGR03016 family PEP-CTERM system-associated outer membrane protein n=2 Tax=Beijerinckia TaxID=532 RepID=B2IH71_BEII9|nr:hypothetical protein Bind_0834 [Beijerinckia indica subsp. indica ATCC 9039]
MAETNWRSNDGFVPKVMPRISLPFIVLLALLTGAEVHAQEASPQIAAYSPQDVRVLSSSQAGTASQTAAYAPQDARAGPLERDIRTLLYYLGPLDRLPFKLAIDQNVFYNDNIQLIPNNTATPTGFSRSDFYSTTNLNGALKFPIGPHTFFVNGGYGLVRYARNPQLNSDNYHVNGGLAWSLGSHCTGDIIGALASYQAPFYQQDLINQINVVSNLSATAGARCHVADRIYAVAGGGWRQYTNSLSQFTSNNRDQTFESVGLTYEGGALDQFGVRATFIHRVFTDRPAVVDPTLSQSLDQRNYTFNFQRTITPRINVSGSAGVTQVQGHQAVSTSSNTWPIYTVSLSWNLTPKISLGYNLSRAIIAPQGLSSDLQSVNSQLVTIGYQFSPRLSFSAQLGRTDLSNQTLNGGINTNIAFQNQRILLAGLLATYRASPLLSFTGSYYYNDRQDLITGVRATANVFMIGLSYHGNGYYVNGGSGPVID